MQLTLYIIKQAKHPMRCNSDKWILFGVVREIERYLKTHVENILRNIQNKQ